MAEQVDFEKLLDGAGRTLAQALAAKWPPLGIQSGTSAQDQREFVQSAVFDLKDVGQIAFNTLVETFLDKVQAGTAEQKVVVLHGPESGVHTVGHDKDKIGAYCHVMIGFIIDRNPPAAG